MKSDVLNRAIGGIDADIIEAADKTTVLQSQNRTRFSWIAAVAAVMIVAVAVTSVALVLNRKSRVATVDGSETTVLNGSIKQPSGVKDDTTSGLGQSATDPVETTRNIGGGEEGVCPVHDTEPYHSISGYLIDMVGSERYEEWLETLPEEYNDNGCNDPVNIVSFIQYFNLTDEQICDFAYGSDYYNWVLDIDSLRSGDYDTFEKKLRVDTYNVTEDEKRSAEQTIKIKLLEYLRDSDNQEYAGVYNKITNNGRNYALASWSIAEVVYTTGITEDVLDNILEEVQYNEFLKIAVNTYDYDFSIIYEGDGLHKEIEELFPVQVDELLRK